MRGIGQQSRVVLGVALLALVAFGGSRLGGGVERSLAGRADSLRILAPRTYHEPAGVTLSAKRLKAFAPSWHGGLVTAPNGEQVLVYVSDSYPDPAVGQTWANFLAGLVHGSELHLLTAYVATPAEVQQLCGSPYALGCYGGNQLLIIGEPVMGISPEMVARHEYGHHVAMNRLNSPWLAVDWGTKRWASYANICARAGSGSAFPGDEDEHYMQNPGEAFAETYRVLNELKAGATTFIWPIVEGSFYPDQGALAAVEQDVVDPWTTPTSQSVQARFTATGKSVWTLPVETRLDGSLTATLTLPRGTLYELTLLTADGRTVLGQGLWSGLGEKRLSATICGQRSVVLKVTRKGAPGRFSVQVTHA